MNILLVDDHALFRDGFRLMLERSLQASARIVEAGSAESGLEAAEHECFDLIFLDLGLPELDGMEGLRAFRHAHPATTLVVLSAIANAETVREALQNGAHGYIPKTVSAAVMYNALEQILAGEVYAPLSTSYMDDSRAPLTGRQVDVLRELCAGRSNKEIAQRLDVSEHTIRAHTTAIFRQINVRSRTEAVLLAKRKGWC
jgi:two-component system, NarL family, nitrate/nitrite response regulator NarL